MSGYPGVPWPDTPSTAGPNRDGRVSESALKALREERATLAQGIGEYLYRLVMSGQMRDPTVIAACRPLYDMEQQIVRMEALLASGAPVPVPPTIPPTRSGSQDDAVTALVSGQSPAWQSGPPLADTPGSPGAPPSAAHHMAHARAADRECSHCRMPLKVTDRVCPVCGRDTADARPLAPVPAMPALMKCARCGTTLRPRDRNCPVCGAVTRSE